jgi:hypothetical protein
MDAEITGLVCTHSYARQMPKFLFIFKKKKLVQVEKWTPKSQAMSAPSHKLPPKLQLGDFRTPSIDTSVDTIPEPEASTEKKNRNKKFPPKFLRRIGSVDTTGDVLKIILTTALLLHMFFTAVLLGKYCSFIHELCGVW